jgi:hypothetical protein
MSVRETGTESVHSSVVRQKPNGNRTLPDRFSRPQHRNANWLASIRVVELPYLDGRKMALHRLQ